MNLQKEWYTNKWSVRCISNRESLYSLFLFVRGVRGSWNSKGVSAVILSAKVCMACFSSFVPFALLVVHGIQRECPLYFRRENNREIRENREQKKGASPGTLDLTKKGVSLLAPTRFKVESKEKVSLPSKVGTESREGRSDPQ